MILILRSHESVIDTQKTVGDCYIIFEFVHCNTMYLIVEALKFFTGLNGLLTTKDKTKDLYNFPKSIA